MDNREAQPQSETLNFLKSWTESFAKLGQAAFSFSPEAVPPEILRQVRAGFFQALAQSWDQFLRSPEFMEGMKQMMDNAVALRKLSSDFLTKARHESGGVAQTDLDALILAVRHMETRLLSGLDALAGEVKELNRRLDLLERQEGSLKSPKSAASSLKGRRQSGAKAQPE